MASGEWAYRGSAAITSQPCLQASATNEDAPPATSRIRPRRRISGVNWNMSTYSWKDRHVIATPCCTYCLSFAGIVMPLSSSQLTQLNSAQVPHLRRQTTGLASPLKQEYTQEALVPPARIIVSPARRAYVRPWTRSTRRSRAYWPLRPLDRTTAVRRRAHCERTARPAACRCSVVRTSLAARRRL